MATVTTASEKLLCHCLRVSTAQVEVAIEVGAAQTVRDVSKQTGAGRACMACHCRIKELLRQRAGERPMLATCPSEASEYAGARAEMTSGAAVEAA